MKINEIEKEVFAYVFFVDISGFGSFLRRASHYKTEVIPFRRKWRQCVDKFEKDNGWYVKRLGDGVLLVWETHRSNTHATAPEALNTVHTFLSEWKFIIDGKESPRPDGVRAAGVYGSIWKEPSTQFAHDYFGDKINLCEKMMKHHRGKCFLVHESLKELVTPTHRRINKFSFTLLPPDRRVNTDHAYIDDMSRLWWVVKKSAK